MKKAPEYFKSREHFFWWVDQYYQTSEWKQTSGDYRDRHPHCESFFHLLLFWWPWTHLVVHHRKYRDAKGWIFYREKDRHLMTVCTACHWWIHLIKDFRKWLAKALYDLIKP